jgi:hypothetical protein
MGKWAHPTFQAPPHPRLGWSLALPALWHGEAPAEPETFKNRDARIGKFGFDDAID